MSIDFEKFQKMFKNTAKQLASQTSIAKNFYFLFEKQMAEKVCRLYLVQYQSGEMPRDEIVIKHIKLM